MAEVSETELVICDEDGRSRGTLRLTVLPYSQRAGLFQHDNPPAGDALAPIQVVEGQEYSYEWLGPEAAITLEPTEVFLADAASGKRGRLRTGLNTGVLPVRLLVSGVYVGRSAIEVRSRKLHYLTEYRWMLRDIAGWMAELVMSRFAPSEMMFSLDSSHDAATLYQRFAFIQSVLGSQSFARAFGEVTSRPHVSWEALEEQCHPGQPVRAGSYLSREVAKPGPRAAASVGPLSSMPLLLTRRRTEATRDTAPNRFVRFALERWQAVIVEIGQKLGEQPSSSAIDRGLRDVDTFLEQLDRLLAEPIFREVGKLAHFPSDNQVLQRRAGYREIYRAYLEFDLAARLGWSDTETKYLAGQRDVAELYEYWVFIQMAQIVGSIVGQEFDLSPLIQRTADGLNLLLKKGRQVDFSGFVERNAARLHIRLYFNKTYSKSSDESWTRVMRPDYSLLISPTLDSEVEPAILHFDAKYRVSNVGEVVGPETGDDDAAPIQGEALRDDLLKMHTYRDAIRRTAGAYVIYPGDATNPTTFEEYTELLPGMGAFALRPSDDGVAVGGATLSKFITDVVDHMATRLTRHERRRHWLRETYQPYDLAAASAKPAEQPADDTSVLLGFVRDDLHWRWIQERRTYNVRAVGRSGGVSNADRLLFSRLLLLYGPGLDRPLLARLVSDPEPLDQAAMTATGYSDAKGGYWCMQIASTRQQPTIAPLTCRDVEQFATGRTRIVGAPVSASWGDLRRLAEERASATH